MPLGTVGRYQLIRKVAQGGMAEVFLAKTYGAHGFEKPVAIKRILGRYAEDEQFVTMLIDEARISSQLNHPNIVPVLDFHADDADCYLVMEYVSGRSLSYLSRLLWQEQRTIPVEHLLYVSKETASGLHHAHVKTDKTGRPLRIVHRDVSPQNVLVSFDGFVKIIDFGIARARDRLAQTEVGTIKGKVRYLSPEQVEGEEVDGRSDIFALGVVMWEALTGRMLFDADNDVAVCDQIVGAAAPDPREYAQDVPSELARAVCTSLQRDRTQRFPSCEAFSAELRGILARLNPDYDPSSLGALLRSLFRQEMDEDRVEEAEAEAELAQAAATGQVARYREDEAITNPDGKPLDRARPSAEEPTAARMRRRSRSKGKRAAEARREAEQEAAQASAGRYVFPPLPENTLSGDDILGGADVAPTRVDQPQRRPPDRPPPTPAAPAPAPASALARSKPARPRKPMALRQQVLLLAVAGAVAGALLALAVGLLTGRSAAPRRPVVVPQAVAPAEPAPPPAAAPVPAPREGRLFLSVEPAGARAWVDGEPVDLDRPVSLPPGEVRLKVSARGFRDEETRVSVEPGTDRWVPVKLHSGRRTDEKRPGDAVLTFTSLGAPATITLDGRVLPETTPLVLVVPAGPHKVVFSWRGKRTPSLDVTLDAGEERTLEAGPTDAQH